MDNIFTHEIDSPFFQELIEQETLAHLKKYDYFFCDDEYAVYLEVKRLLIENLKYEINRYYQEETNRNDELINNEICKKIKKTPLGTSGRKSAAFYLYNFLDRPFADDTELFFKILNAAIFQKSWLYTPIKKLKKNGKGHRLLLIPCPELKLIQQRINQKILNPALAQTLTEYQGRKNQSKSLKIRKGKHFCSYGYSGGSVINALKPLAQSGQIIFSTDVKDAYPSTSSEAVFNVFRSLKYGKNVSYFLTCLTTWHLGAKNNLTAALPQGSPTSPKLFDLCFQPFDEEFHRLAKNKNGVYIRYADNLFFTADDFWKTHYNPDGTKIIKHRKNKGAVWFSPIISKIYRIINEGYFIIYRYRNFQKETTSKFYQKFTLHKSFMAKPEIVFNSLGLNIIDGQIHNTPRFKNKIRLTVFNLKKKLQAKEDFETQVWPLYKKLQGYLNFMVEETFPKSLFDQVDELILEIESIRFSGSSGTWVKNPKY